MSVRHPQSRVVGQRIAAARQAAVLSQQAFADLLKALEPGQEWSRETVVNLELGRRAITIERLLAMAAVLHTPPSAFLVDDAALAAVITRLGNEPALIGHVSFFLDTLSDELPTADTIETDESGRGS